MKQCNNIKSFSLIEVAIAVTLLALFFGGIIAVFDRGAISAKKTHQQAAAYSLARAVLEEYSNWPSLDVLDGGPPDGLAANNAYTLPAITLNNIIYTPTLAISDGPISPAQLKLLTAAIAWTDGIIARSISVSTLKANY